VRLRAIIFFGGIAILPFWGALYYLALGLGVSQEAAPPVAWGMFIGIIVLGFLALGASGKTQPNPTVPVDYYSAVPAIPWDERLLSPRAEEIIRAQARQSEKEQAKFRRAVWAKLKAEGRINA